MKGTIIVNGQPILLAPLMGNAKPMTPDMVGHKPMKITFMPQSKYKFSRANWHVADFDTQYYFEVEEWCKEQFGPHPKYPDAWSRWVHTYEDQIHFRDQKDYHWFVLRWGG